MVGALVSRAPCFVAVSVFITFFSTEKSTKRESENSNKERDKRVEEREIPHWNVF